jgi:hypothetical protein
MHLHTAPSTLAAAAALIRAGVAARCPSQLYIAVVPSQARTQLHANDVGGPVAPEARRGQQRLHTRCNTLLLHTSTTRHHAVQQHTVKAQVMAAP